jgi:hypothetical protein
VLRDDLRRQGELGGGLVLAFGGDDLPPALPLGLGLLGHGPLHLVGQVDVLDLHAHHLDAPRIGPLVDDDPDDLVDLLPLGEEFVQFGLPDDAPQGGLGELTRGEVIVLDLHHRLGRVRDAEVHHRVDFDRYVVLGDGVLRGDVQGHDAEIHLLHPLDPERDQEDETRALGPGQLPQPEDHPPLEFPEDAHTRENAGGANDDERDQNGREVHEILRSRVRSSATV